MTLLWELGLAAEIPPRTVRAMVRAFHAHFLPFLPLKPSDVPPGADPDRNFPCHCALGTMFQVLTACGVEVDRELPWVRSWFLTYQFSDGGLNCDGGAFSKPQPKGSLVSTLPPLEAVLTCTPRTFTLAEERFLDRGAHYLLSHRLFRSSAGKVIDAEWLKPCFPRFYHYDVLRALRYLFRWAKARQKALPRRPLADAMDSLLKRYPDGKIVPERFPWTEEKTLLQDSEGTWAHSRPATSFALLVEASIPDVGARFLSREWDAAA